MIVNCNFKGDNNEALKWDQHDNYQKSLANIFSAAKSALIQADAIIGSNLPIVEKVLPISSFDHRVLQNAHDIIAAAYRYKNDDGGQLRLFVGPKSLYSDLWSNWLTQELEALIVYPQFVQSIIESVVFSNTKQGYLAEEKLRNILFTHYSYIEWFYG